MAAEAQDSGQAKTLDSDGNSLVAFSGDPRYGTATERLPSVAVRNANNTGKSQAGIESSFRISVSLLESGPV
jgi:hypothetical protein